VLIGGLPAARITDKAQCAGPTAMIVKGSACVLINGLSAARIGDSTMHGGVIVTGLPTVLIGECGGFGVGGFGAAAPPAEDCVSGASRAGSPFART
jgi:hypothetical protein